MFTTESGSARTKTGQGDAERLNKWFGWGGNAFVLHGGSVPITTAVHWNPRVWKLLDEWGDSDDDPIITLAGSTHRWATAALLEQIATGAPLLTGVTHCVPWPIGKNNILKWDKQREAELGGLLRWLDETGNRLGVDARLAVGDFNGPRTDSYDGPGKAMARYGWRDAAVMAGGNDRAIIDRFAVKGLTIVQHKVLPTRGATDHDYAAAIKATG